MTPYPAVNARETLNIRSSCHTEAAIEIPTSKDAMLLANGHPGGGAEFEKKTITRQVLSDLNLELGTLVSEPPLTWPTTPVTMAFLHLSTMPCPPE